jgi:hypothetical protein
VQLLARHANSKTTELYDMNRRNVDRLSGASVASFMSSIDVRRIETLKDGTDAVGNRTRAKIVKICRQSSRRGHATKAPFFAVLRCNRLRARRVPPNRLRAERAPDPFQLITARRPYEGSFQAAQRCSSQPERRAAECSCLVGETFQQSSWTTTR